MAFLGKFGGIVASGSFHNTFDNGAFGDGDRLSGHGTGDFRRISNLDPALSEDIALDMARHDDDSCPDRSYPVGMLSQSDRAFEIAVAINLAGDLKIASSGYKPRNLAAFID